MPNPGHIGSQLVKTRRSPLLFVVLEAQRLSDKYVGICCVLDHLQVHDEIARIGQAS